MSTVHLNGAVSPGKAARNPQELVAFLRAKRKSGGGSQIMEAPGAGGPPGPAPPLPAAAGGDGGGASANPLLAEIEQAAMLRDQRVGAAPAADAASLREHLRVVHGARTVAAEENVLLLLAEEHLPPRVGFPGST